MFWRTTLIAARSLRRNLLRTLLTMLGVAIGVAAVISMLAMVSGATLRVQSAVAGIGVHVLFVLPRPPRSAGVSRGYTVKAKLVPADVTAIVKDCPAIVAASPIDMTTAQCVYQDRNWSTFIVGSGPDYPYVRNMKLVAGRYFADDEVRAMRRVCVLGSSVADHLFGDVDPVGSVIRIKQEPFVVVGEFASKGGSGMGVDQDDRVYAPVSTVMTSIDHQPYLDYAMASARDEAAVPIAKRQITALLRQRWHVPEHTPNNFEIFTQTQIAQQVNAEGAIMTLFLGGVAAISLLVGGIGIMNVMLVSVTERVREIGIRMGVGARSRDILLQFLTEALVLSSASGVLGVMAGYAIASLAAHLSKWPFHVSSASILLAFGSSVAVGVFFGIFPAFKASRLDPIEALRVD